MRIDVSIIVAVTDTAAHIFNVIININNNCASSIWQHFAGHFRIR